MNFPVPPKLFYYKNMNPTVNGLGMFATLLFATLLTSCLLSISGCQSSPGGGDRGVEMKSVKKDYMTPNTDPNLPAKKEDGSSPPPTAAHSTAPIHPQPPPSSPPGEGKGQGGVEARNRADALIQSWAKSLESRDAKEALGDLVAESDLNLIASPGIREILSSSLVPENQRIVKAILERKEVKLLDWKSGKIGKTEAGSLYKEPVQMMRDAVLQLILDEDMPSELSMDLIEVGDLWKIFKLEVKE